MTIDAAGNLLVPFNWQGLLATNGGVPVPRLVARDAALAARLHRSRSGVPRLVHARGREAAADLRADRRPDGEPTPTSSRSSDRSTRRTPSSASRAAPARARTRPAVPACSTTDCPTGGTCPTTCVGGSAPPGTVCANDGPVQRRRPLRHALRATSRRSPRAAVRFALPRTPVGHRRLPARTAPAVHDARRLRRGRQHLREPTPSKRARRSRSRASTRAPPTSSPSRSRSASTSPTTTATATRPTP